MSKLIHAKQGQALHYGLSFAYACGPWKSVHVVPNNVTVHGLAGFRQYPKGEKLRNK